VVPVSGYDVWLIATRQRLSPEQFLVAHPQKEAAADGFILRADGPPLGLALDKQGRFQPTQPCVFLMQLGGGEYRCGIYHDRPLVCRTYPMAMWNGAISQRGDTLCPPDSWVQDATLEAWHDDLQRLRMHWDLYAQVVDHWNDRVKAVGAEREFGITEYLGYVLSVYDRIAVLDQELGRRELTRVVAEWPNLPRASALSGASRGAVSGWQRYLDRVQSCLEGFFPGHHVRPPRFRPIAGAPLPPSAAATPQARAEPGSR
jgi:Fe-S-cluster containining protein